MRRTNGNRKLLMWIFVFGLIAGSACAVLTAISSSIVAIFVLWLFALAAGGI